MNAILITLNIIVLSCLVALGLQWPQAFFALLVVGPLSILSTWGIWHVGLSARLIFISTAAIALTTVIAASYIWSAASYGFLIVGPVVLLGLFDMLQSKRAILRNFPIIGHARYFFEAIRPEIQQYFVESNTDGKPFPREERAVIYQRAKGARDTLPFGTQRDVYAEGYEWINHSMAPVKPEEMNPRIQIGTETCEKPYSASILNISAMSFGALSGKAIESLNIGAREGGFAHNTGEGAISPHHRQGGDLIWQIGTGYFGCRTRAGEFDPEKFTENATQDAVRMIEIKLSQGAKPGHGGILPAAKITPEIAAIRGVPLGEDVISPPAHSAFSTPTGLLEFVVKLRELSGGKPVGFKLCVGKRREFLAVCKAMIETGMHPDFIAVDGGEGGTGAAPIEFSNSLGCPLVEGLTFVHNSLVGSGLRERVKIIASGKVASGFGLVRRISLGADGCYAARSMMMSIGCIQARKCNSNDCPVGVATQNPTLTAGLVVSSKAQRVTRYHAETINAAMELIGAAGLTCPSDLRPWHIMRRVSAIEVRHFDEIVDYLEPGSLLGSDLPKNFERAWNAATASSFQHLDGHSARA
ncbi:MAG: FMN-binding glutamate synthase family protein [Deltaproteobacteria bacterium]|nr:FMN-binding glutamate synthase family protein [Deltaproteobacteria bacterium]